MAHFNLIAQRQVPMPSISGLGIDPGANAVTATAQLDNLITNVITLLSIVALIYFTLQIIFAGYAFLSAEGDKNKLQAARDRLTNGVLGLFIALIAVFLTALLATLFGFDTADTFNLSTFFSSVLHL